MITIKWKRSRGSLTCFVEDYIFRFIKVEYGFSSLKMWRCITLKYINSDQVKSIDVSYAKTLKDAKSKIYQTIKSQ